MRITLRDVVLPLSHFTLEVSLAIEHSATAIYGPSGSGKTSLLEIIAGLRRPVRGSVQLGDRIVFDAAQRIAIPPRELHVGYVPQDDALFPHLDVRQNILYGARANDTLPHVLRVLEIEHLLDRAVRKLSGGERKRVALARALASEPSLLLLDEPLTGVDRALRARVLDYLVRIRDEFPIPLLYVTHEVDEARALCHAQVTLDQGRVVSETAPTVQ